LLNVLALLQDFFGKQATAILGGSFRPVPLQENNLHSLPTEHPSPGYADDSSLETTIHHVSHTKIPLLFPPHITIHR
ncbi:hypothetical protein AVEN_167463-1, partial [Araneus ventricosus]